VYCIGRAVNSFSIELTQTDAHRLCEEVVFGSVTDSISLLIVMFLLGYVASLSKSPRLCRFKSDQDEIWQDCSSSTYASTDGVGFLI